MATLSCSTTQATYIASLAEIVEIILCFLPAKSLSTAAQVCRLWRVTARRLFRSRRRWVSYLVHHGNHVPCTSKLSMDLLAGRITNFLENICIYPESVILFVSRSPEYCEGRRDEMKSLLAAVRLRLPKSCALIGCIGGGTVGCLEGETAEEVETSEAVCLMVMPRVEGVSAHLFNMSCTEVRHNRTFKARWEKSLKLPDDKQIKFAVLLAKGDTYNLDIIGKVASGIWQVHDTDGSGKSNVVIIGGLVESLMFVDNDVKSSGVIGLGICGNAQAMSIVHHGETTRGVTQSLCLLKDSDIQTDSSACFMVSCVGRGETFYKSKNVETGIFQKEFPSVPIGGFFGNGEVGLDQHSTEGKPLKDSHFLHSYSSVFCLCSLGKPLTPARQQSLGVTGRQ